jgi:hypothetical protein
MYPYRRGNGDKSRSQTDALAGVAELDGGSTVDISLVEAFVALESLVRINAH